MSSEPETENLLALAVHRADAGAFERMVERFDAPLFNYVNRILQNRFDAQEVVQDTFLRAHRALTRQYDAARCEQLALRAWLFRISRNLSYNKRRGKHSPELEQPLSAFDDGRIGPLVSAATAGRGIEQQQEVAALERAIERLPIESRELVILRFVEEMSYAEISKTTGFNEASLRGKVFRALKLLRETLSAREVAHAM